MTKKPTIYEIKRLTKETAPFFFTRDTMRYFNQRLKDFKVHPLEKGRFKITAPSKTVFLNAHGDPTVHDNTTVRYFNPITNELEVVIPATFHRPAGLDKDET